MGNWAIDDSHGNWIAGGYQDEGKARAEAHRLANERGEVVALYCDGVDGYETVEPAERDRTPTKSAVIPPTRCTPEELGRWKDAAASQGLTLAEWIRRELTQAADFCLAQKP